MRAPFHSIRICFTNDVTLRSLATKQPRLPTRAVSLFHRRVKNLLNTSQLHRLRCLLAANHAHLRSERRQLVGRLAQRRECWGLAQAAAEREARDARKALEDAMELEMDMAETEVGDQCADGCGWRDANSQKTRPHA